MRHAFMYQGSYDSNFTRQQQGSNNFLGSDGQEHQIQEWPAGIDGLRVGYMEKTGKKFVAARVQDGSHDVILANEVVIDPPRHMGFGKRFSAEPTIVDDDAVALTLIEDIIRKNPGNKALFDMRERLKSRRPHGREG